MNRDYTNKTVYVGIDVHKKSYTVYCNCDGEKVKSWSMAAHTKKLIEQLKAYFSGARLCSVYEAGFSGFALHRELVFAGIDNMVVNPGSIETASRDRVKTDKRDAKKLAEQLSDRRLKSIYIPSIEEELLRISTRMRQTLVADRKRVTCRIKSKLFQFGYNDFVTDDKANEAWIKKINSATCFPEELKSELDYWCKHWFQLTEDIKAQNKKIAKQSRENGRCAQQEAIYRSTPGLGNLSAKALSRELGDLQQFHNNKGVYSYLGLTPSESSSGERRKQGGISHCGRPYLRHLLIEVAWRSIRKDQELAQKFEKLSYRRGKKRAIVAIARILIGRIRTCFKNGVLYQAQTLIEEAVAL
ncbi:TPA: IS110 family transposase [Legionella pneumophila]|nr:IS110 family transposase [Legionella pneumophila]HEO1392054.1 IS110 family transposase [Legionella pneumophila]